MPILLREHIPKSNHSLEGVEHILNQCEATAGAQGHFVVTEALDVRHRMLNFIPKLSVILLLITGAHGRRYAESRNFYPYECFCAFSRKPNDHVRRTKSMTRLPPCSACPAACMNTSSTPRALSCRKLSHPQHYWMSSPPPLDDFIFGGCGVV